VTLLHLHLLLNHVPTVGLGLGFALFVAAWLGSSDDLKRASCLLFFVIALLAVPTYVTGDAARFALRDHADVSPDVIAAHQDAAMLALIPMEMTGLMAWIALWRFRPWHPPALVGLSIVTLALMARAATLGGQIRHPEILAEGAAAFPAGPRAAAIAAALVLDHPWVWPICEIFHFVGLCLLFGVVMVVNLRVLGFLTGVAVADVARLLPWALVGLGINLVTGMLFFLAAPDQYTQNIAFAWKIGLVVMGGVTLAYPVMSAEVLALKPDTDASLTAKLIAAGSVVLWLGVIFFGRFLPYLGAE
jgi:uncharacterized membrane protein